MAVPARKRTPPRARRPGGIPSSEARDGMRRRVLGVAEAVGDFIAYWGFKAIHGKVWTLLALSTHPRTQIEIARTLGVSRSLISGSVAELSRLGLVRAVGDERNAPYEAVLDVWPTISDVLRSREWMLIESARVALEAALDEAAVVERVEPGASSEWSAERMRFLLKMTEVAQTFIRLLLRIRAAPAVETFSGWLTRAAGLVSRLG